MEVFFFFLFSFFFSLHFFPSSLKFLCLLMQAHLYHRNVTIEGNNIHLLEGGKHVASAWWGTANFTADAGTHGQWPAGLESTLSLSLGISTAS